MLVDPATRALSHTGARCSRAGACEAGGAGSAHPDAYAALVELASPIGARRRRGRAPRSRLGARVRAPGATPLGAGLHPAGAFGDVVHVDERATARSATSSRAHEPHADLRAARPRRHARRRDGDPRLQRPARAPAAAAGAGRQLAVLARPRLGAGERARADVPRLPARGDPAGLRLATTTTPSVAAVLAAGDLPDYTFLWWDIRPHPRLGTVEVARWTPVLAGHGGRAGGADPRAGAPRGGGGERGLVAARGAHGVELPRRAATGCGRAASTARCARSEIGRAALALAARTRSELGSADALEEIERILTEGGGADRQRAAHARGGMPALLDGLVAEAAEAYR